MADEISINVNLAVTNGTLKDSFSRAYTADQTNAGGPSPGYVVIGTSEEEVTFTELTSAGWIIMQNTDPTNYVEWGFSTGVYGGRMRAGETAGPFRMNGTSIFARANTAACGVLFKAYRT